MVSSLQAGLDKMAKGHMLADVVAIIGEKAIQPKKKKISELPKKNCTEPLLLLLFFVLQVHRTSCSARWTVNAMLLMCSPPPRGASRRPPLPAAVHQVLFLFTRHCSKAFDRLLSFTDVQCPKQLNKYFMTQQQRFK